MDHGSVITISLGAIDHNVRILRKLVGPTCGVCGVVKANAYGLGAVRIARQLVASGVDMLAVFGPEEAAELFDAGIGVPVLVLMPVWEIGRTDELYRALVRGSVHLTVHNAQHLRQLVHLAERYAAPLSVHLELDTGMSRGGCAENEAAAMLQTIAGHRLLKLAGLFTHFARARDSVQFTNRQRSRFERFVKAHAALIGPECRLHIANTAATLRGETFHKSMIRVGLAWAGYGTELLPDGEAALQTGSLQPSVRWTSRIVLSKEIEKGQTVGYGAAWTAKRRTRLGLIPIGYADGFPIELRGLDKHPSAARVGLKAAADAGAPQSFAQLVAALSMDQITVDITDAPWAGVGTVVELIGTARDAPNYLTKIATGAGVIPHVILAGLNPAIPRRYEAPASVVETITTTAAHRAAGELAAAVRGLG